MKTPKIKTCRTWNPDSVRQCCISYGLYTDGDSADYSHMLETVRKSEPTPENIYIVAADIFRHSDAWKAGTVTNIMYFLESSAVTTFYEITEDTEEAA